MLKRLFFYTICYCTLVALAIFTGEFCLRALAPSRTMGSLLRPDTRLGYRHVAHGSTTQYLDRRYIPMRTNGMGLRQDEEITEKKPGEFRILVMGDSFVLGWGSPIEKTFYSLIKDKAQARFPDRSIFFMNGGHGAWGTEQVVGFVEDHVAELKPDLVITFLGANDMEDNARLNDIYIEQGNTLVRNYEPKTMLANRSWIAQKLPFYDWVLYNSYLFQMTRPALRAMQAKIAGFGLFATQEPVKPVALPRRLSPNERVLAGKETGDLEDSAVEKKTVKLLAYLKNTCEGKGSALWLINTGGASRETTIFFDKLPRLLKGTKLEYHDMRPYWEEAFRQAKVPIYLTDGHFNEDGNRIFANAIWPPVEKYLTSVFSQ